MRRTALIKKIKKAAREAGVEFETFEMTRHTALMVGGIRTGVGRHREIDEVTAGKICANFEDVLGEGWWRK